MTALNGKAVELVALEAELAAAGIATNGLGTADDEIFTYDADGVQIDLPAGAEAVIAAHVLPDLPPSDTDLYGEYLDMVQEVSSDVGVQILSEIVRGLLR